MEVHWTPGSPQYMTRGWIIGSRMGWDHNSASSLRMSPFVGPDLEGEKFHASTKNQRQNARGVPRAKSARARWRRWATRVSMMRGKKGVEEESNG